MLVAQGLTIMEALKTIGLRLATYRHWRQELEGLKLDEARRVKLLEAENPSCGESPPTSRSAPRCFETQSAAASDGPADTAAHAACGVGYHTRCTVR